MKRIAMGALALVACSIALIGRSLPVPGAQADADARAWNQPVKPFHIIGNIDYVGAKEISSFLIVTPRGDILLDGGYVQTAPQIEQSFCDTLALLETHLSSRAYLFGARPAFADFAVWGQIYNLWTDPTPGALIEGRAPTVLAWVQRTLWPRAAGAFAM